MKCANCKVKDEQIAALAKQLKEANAKLKHTIAWKDAAVHAMVAAAIGEAFEEELA